MNIVTLTIPATALRVSELGTAPDGLPTQEMRFYDGEQLTLRLSITWPHGAERAPVVMQALPRTAGDQD